MRDERGVMLILLLLPVFAFAAEKPAEDDAKVISGMSIVGNSEAPKSLTIVPWKGADVGDDGDLNSNLLDAGLVPVDREVFMREVRFYELSNP